VDFKTFINTDTLWLVTGSRSEWSSYVDQMGKTRTAYTNAVRVSSEKCCINKHVTIIHILSASVVLFLHIILRIQDLGFLHACTPCWYTETV
jgi:hypothetical protein